MPIPACDSGAGLSNFFSPPYQVYNRARLAHLESLRLPLANRRVLELGSGPGDHTGFYVQRGCAVVSVDARQDCLDVLKQRYPGAKAELCDLNDPAALGPLGSFEVIHCYGILYHLEEPSELIRYMGEACSGLAVVETCVRADNTQPADIVDEAIEDFTQSSTGRGSRPTREWVFEALGRSFPFVYQTQTQPNHPEFPVNWQDLTYAPPLIRAVFVASKQPLDLPSLSPRLLDVQQRLDPAAYIGVLESTLAEHRAILEEREQLCQRLHLEADERLVAMQDRDREVEIREQRIAALEAVAAERLAAMVDRDREIAIREQRIAALEAVAAERLAAMVDRDREIGIREQRIAALEAVAAERLAAMQDRDREIEIREQRIANLESVAAERLAAMVDRDREIEIREQRIARLKSMVTQPLAAMVDWDREIGIREQRIANLESVAAERLTAMLDRDREIEIREQRIAGLESIAAERLTAMQDRDREIEIRERRIAQLRP